MTAPAIALEPAGAWKPSVTIRYSRAGRPRNAAIRPLVLRPFHAIHRGGRLAGAMVLETPVESQEPSLRSQAAGSFQRESFDASRPTRAAFLASQCLHLNNGGRDDSA